MTRDWTLEREVAAEKRCEKLEMSQDFDWYWTSFGEKCYCWGTVAAFWFDDENEDARKPMPPPGFLSSSCDTEHLYLSKDGSRLMIDTVVVDSERQDGNVICEFVAHARYDLPDAIREIRRLRAELSAAQGGTGNRCVEIPGEEKL